MKGNLPVEVAEQILNNVFTICERDRSNVPLETLLTLGSYHRQRFILQRIVSYLSLVLFLLLPLMFVVAELQLTAAVRGYRLDVSARIPVKGVRAVMLPDETPVSVRVDSGDSYLLLPPADGEMSVRVELKNGQVTEQSFSVSKSDLQRPLYNGRKVIGADLYVYVSDEDSGIDFDTVAVSPAGAGFRIDKDESCIILPFPDCDVSVSVKDRAGNELRVNLTIDRDSPVLESMRTEDGDLLLFVRDDGSGIDFETVTILGIENGYLCDEAAGCITITPCPLNDITVKIKDLSGNELTYEISYEDIKNN